MSSGPGTVPGKSFLPRRIAAIRTPIGTVVHSGDYRIGTHYLDEPILDNIKGKAMQIPFLKDLLRSDAIYIRNNITVPNRRIVPMA